jgi:ABC-type dipeptide/oligopeptide/nickel transport system ATPase component
MRIIEFQAENVKKLKVVVIHPKPGPGVVQITGPNGSGKTSVLDSILYTLAGTEDLPSQPIRRGADKGAVMIDLGDIRVMRKFTPGGSVLMVEGKKGERYQKPQQLLNQLFGNMSFDPLAFTRMKPKEQAEQLRSLVRLEIDPDAIDVANKADYDARTMVHRDIKALQAQVDAISIVAELPEKSIDVTKLITELEAAGSKNAEVVAIQGEVIRRRDFNAENRAAAGRLRISIEEMKAQIVKLEASAKEKEKAADAEDEKIAAMKIPDAIDTSALRESIENARATNTQIERRNQKATLQAKLDEQTKLAQSYSDAIKEREQKKADAIGKADMPVEGLGFENGEVMFNSLPFNQASGAEQLRVSLAIAMASNPELRVIRIVDGSLLDHTSMEIVKKMAIERDYQIWIESVDTSGKVGIVMEDGEVKTVNEEEPTSIEDVKAFVGKGVSAQKAVDAAIAAAPQRKAPAKVGAAKK